MLAYLVRGHICSEKRKLWAFQEQIMSIDKSPSKILPQMEVIVFIILQILFATRAVLKIGEYHSDIPQF